MSPGSAERKVLEEQRDKPSREGVFMKDTLGWRSGSFVCPYCESDQPGPSGHDFVSCASCGGLLSGTMLETLQQIRSLPEGLGGHACECGHPEMRRLPDGVFHCPACGSEVLPLETGSTHTTLVDNPHRKDRKSVV